MFSTVFEHSRGASSTWKNIRALDCVSCSKIFPSAENNPGVLKNSTEHAEPLLIALVDFLSAPSRIKAQQVKCCEVKWKTCFQDAINLNE